MFTISESEVLPLGVDVVTVETMHLTRPMFAHVHGFAGLAFVRSGHATQHTQHGTTTLRTGHVVVMGPGSWHAYDPQDAITLSNLYISGDLLAGELAWLARLPRIGVLLGPAIEDEDRPVLTLDVGIEVIDAVAPPLDALAGAGDDNIFRRLAHLFAVLASIVPVLASAADAELMAPAVLGPGPRAPTRHSLIGGRHHGVEQAISLLYENIDEHWTLAELARQLSVSASQLVRIFNAGTGISPMAYLQRTRAERFAYLLRSTELTVAAAGRAVGWHDAGYASRRFRCHWGLSPTAYRARFSPSGNGEIAPGADRGRLAGAADPVRMRVNASWER